jgi:hypothetical protein
MAYYVLTSTNTPDRLEVFDPIEGQDGFHTINNGFDHTLCEVNEALSIKGAKVTNKTRYVALLEGNTKRLKIVTEGIIGTVDLSEGPWHLTVYGPDGQTVYQGDAEECPNVLPPEVFGLTSYVWWNSVKR